MAGIGILSNVNIHCPCLGILPSVVFKNELKKKGILFLYSRRSISIIIKKDNY